MLWDRMEERKLIKEKKNRRRKMRIKAEWEGRIEEEAIVMMNYPMKSNTPSGPCNCPMEMKSTFFFKFIGVGLLGKHMLSFLLFFEIKIPQ